MPSKTITRQSMPSIATKMALIYIISLIRLTLLTRDTFLSLMVAKIVVGIMVLLPLISRLSLDSVAR